MWLLILNRSDGGLIEKPKLLTRKFVNFVVHDGVLEYIYIYKQPAAIKIFISESIQANVSAHDMFTTGNNTSGHFVFCLCVIHEEATRHCVVHVLEAATHNVPAIINKRSTI